MTQSDRRATAGPALRGALVGASTALIAFGGVSVALAATQSGIDEASAPVARPSTTQAGLDVAKKASATPRSAKAAQATSPRTATQRPAQVKQAGVAKAVQPAREVKEEEKRDEGRESASEVDTAPVRQAPTQQVRSAQPAPAQRAPSYPVQRAPSYPVQQAPSYPVRQAPAPAPAPVPAPAPAPAPAPQGITIDLGGRAPVVPQAPIPPKQLHIG